MFNGPKVLVALMVLSGAMAGCTGGSDEDPEDGQDGEDGPPELQWDSEFLRIRMVDHSIEAGVINITLEYATLLEVGCANVIFESLATEAGNRPVSGVTGGLCPGTSIQDEFLFAAPSANPNARWTLMDFDYANLNEANSRDMKVDLTPYELP